MTTEEACQKVRALKALVECLRTEAVRHPDDREVHDDWRASCRDLDLATAALAELTRPIDEALSLDERELWQGLIDEVRSEQTPARKRGAKPGDEGGES